MGQHAHLYNSRAWKKKRAAQLMAKPLCNYCALQGITKPGRVADHVNPHRGDVDSFWAGALQTLCYTCHNSAKQIKENKNILIGGDARGYPADVNHLWNK